MYCSNFKAKTPFLQQKHNILDTVNVEHEAIIKVSSS